MDALNNILEKISTYDILNNFIPGAVYVVLADKMTTWSFLNKSVWVNLIFFYVAGLIISRIGSIIVEPVMKKQFGKKKRSVVKMAPYGDYLDAEKIDPKIEKLSMLNNTYRTFISMFLCLGITCLINIVVPNLGNYGICKLIGCFLLAILFICSYWKQTNYVRKRVYKTLGKEDK